VDVALALSKLVADEMTGETVSPSASRNAQFDGHSATLGAPKHWVATGRARLLIRRAGFESQAAHRYELYCFTGDFTPERAPRWALVFPTRVPKQAIYRIRRRRRIHASRVARGVGSLRVPRIRA
jgi:hypothetical protein